MPAGGISTGKWLRALRPLFNALAIVGLLITAWFGYQLGPWISVEGAPGSAAEPLPWTAVNPIGVNTFLAREVETWKRERTVEMVADMGAGWLKEHFSWAEIEPENDVFWDAKYQQDAWAKYDQIVALAESHGLRVVARIDQTPGWARPPGTDQTIPPTNVEAFGDFIEEFVRHYQGRVNFLQIWNEPNLAAEWGGEIDPAGYAALLEEAATRARAVDPNVVILSAPMAMTTENSGRAMNELSYWDALLELGAAQYFDIMTANAYGLDDRYDQPPDVSTLNLRRVELLRDLAVQHGLQDVPIWLNEYGWNASPSDFQADLLTWSRVSEQEQADWSARGIQQVIDDWPWFGVANIWYFRQVGDIAPSRSDFYFRMVDVEFTPRPIYHRVSDLGHDLRVAGVGSYGDLQAPVRAIGPWTIVRDDQASNGEYIVGRAGDRIILSFTGTHVWLDLGPGQREGTLSYAVSEGMDPPGSNTSMKTVDIPIGATSLEIVSNGGSNVPGTRTLTLEVGADTEVLLDGVTFDYRRSYDGVALGGFVLAVGCLGSLAGRRGDRK